MGLHTEYVDLVVDFILTKSMKTQFEAFKLGFLRVCQQRPLQVGAWVVCVCVCAGVCAGVCVSDETECLLLFGVCHHNHTIP